MKKLALLLAASTLVACSSDETGTVTFTTWGEEYIEDGIPAGEGGFVDGWSIKYEKFLVAFAQIQVADGSGDVGAAAEQSFIVDNVQPGRKELVTFTDLEAKAWDRVSYQIKPPTDDATLVSATSKDLKILLDGGYSLYIEATATKADVTKTFAFGFQNAIQYSECQAAENGKETPGILVTNGSDETIELTTHGDHFFYDRLQGSAGANIETSLRFETIAKTDANDDGVLTVEELEVPVAELELPPGEDFVELYDPSGLPADNMLEFMTGLARTVGHFRGEGECTVSQVED
jgi:hypothetical protein